MRGRSAVVTGGASGMGLATCRRLSQEGAAVAVLDLDGGAAERVAKELSTETAGAVGVRADVSDRSEVDEAISEVRDQLGPIHVLVNCAGLSAFAPFATITGSDWERLLAVNLTGTFNCMQAVVPDMVAAGWGRIISIASLAGQTGCAHMAHYAAAKAGVLGLTKSVAREVGAMGVTVNAIAPGGINTPMLAAMMTGDLGVTPDDMGGPLPIGRVGEPEEIAATVAFLASDGAGYITGQVVAVNGGVFM